MIFLLLSCSPEPATAELAEEVQTVVRVNWSSRGESRDYVEFGTDASYGHRTSDSDGTEHEALLLGMPAETRVHFRVVSDGRAGEDQTITTGVLPNFVHPGWVTGDTGWPGAQLIVLVSIECTVLMVDAEGQVIWYYRPPDDIAVYSAEWSRDRRALLIGAIGTYDMQGQGQVQRFSLDGMVERSWPVPYLTHDFVELPDGSLAATEALEDGLGTWADRLIEVSPDGEPREVWNALDHFERPDDFEGGDDYLDTWSHANAVFYDAESDTYTLGFRNLSTLVHIDRGSGETLWTLGQHSLDGVPSFDTPDPDDIFDHQHHFSLAGDQLLLYDNGSQEKLASRAIQYTLDEGTMTAESGWSYQVEPPYYSYVLGQAEWLDSGLRQVVWSTAGVIQDVTEDGEVAWSYRLGLANGLGYGQRVESLYP